MKSAVELEATGAWDKNKKRRRTEEPVPPDGALIKPRLKGLASKIWDIYAPICLEMKTAAHGDELAFTTLCNMEAEYQKDPDGMQTSRLAERMKVLERFGLAGRGSRAKLALKTKDEGKKDPADKYFGNVTIGPGNSVRQ